MSGVEIVAAVAGLVLAFNNSVDMYRSWRDKKRERSKNAENRRLEPSLTRGGSTVQLEYGGHFARMGRRFAVGDDRGRAELWEYVARLQQIIIERIVDSNSQTSLVWPNLPTIYSTSEDTRIGVVSALTEQY